MHGASKERKSGLYLALHQKRKSAFEIISRLVGLDACLIRPAFRLALCAISKLLPHTVIVEITALGCFECLVRLHDGGEGILDLMKDLGILGVIFVRVECLSY